MITKPFHHQIHSYCFISSFKGSRCGNVYQQHDNQEEFARWIIEELRAMSSARHSMYDNPMTADRGRGQYGDRVDGCQPPGYSPALCKHQTDKSPGQQFLPPPASPRQRQPSPSSRMAAPSPSPCSSGAQGQSSSPWTPVTPRKRKHGTIIKKNNCKL